MLNAFISGLLVCLLTCVLTVGAAPAALAQSAAGLSQPAIAPVTMAQSSTDASTELPMAGKKSLFSFSGTRPTDLGETDGKLAACSESPNCVSSQAPEADAEHYIAPIAYSGTAADAIAALKSAIEMTERTTLVNATDRYLYAEYASALMGFVDDVEFVVDDAAKVIHVRSASRLGKSDLGVNRTRVEALRAAFNA